MAWTEGHNRLPHPCKGAATTTRPGLSIVIVSARCRDGERLCQRIAGRAAVRRGACKGRTLGMEDVDELAPHVRRLQPVERGSGIAMRSQYTDPEEHRHVSLPLRALVEPLPYRRRLCQTLIGIRCRPRPSDRTSSV